MPFWLKGTRLSSFCPPSPPCSACVMVRVLVSSYPRPLARAGTPEEFGRTRAFSGGKGEKSGGKSGGKFGNKKGTRKPLYEKPKGGWSKGKGKGDWGKDNLGKGPGKHKRRDKQWH